MNVIAILLCTLVNQVASQTNGHLCVPTHHGSLMYSASIWSNGFVHLQKLTLRRRGSKLVAKQQVYVQPEEVPFGLLYDNFADFFPARILAQQKTISENSDLYATCSTFGLKKHTETRVHVYLCKDGRVIKRKPQKPDQNDTSFTIPKVHLNYSGNYSCVYSLKDYSGPQVCKRGDNIIPILVIANFLPADMSVAGPSTVSEGDDVELRCTVSDTLQTLDGCQLIHSYLMRNESILQVRAFNVTQMEAVFTIEVAVVRDSGHYSCVVLPSKCIQEHERTLYGNNAVLLKVKDEVSFFLRVIVSCGVTTMILALGVCLWCIKQGQGKSKGNSALCKPRMESQEANTAVMLEEQQEQTEEEDLEAQDGESFSEDEDEDEEEDQYTCPAEDSNPSDDCEGLYSTAERKAQLTR